MSNGKTFKSDTKTISAMLAQLRVMVLFLIMFGLMAAIGLVLGAYFHTDPMGTMAIFFIIAMLFNLVSYFASDKLVLKAYRARIVTGPESPQAGRLVGIVKHLTARAELPMPRVAIIPSENPNAFATGRNPENAVVAATEGLMGILDDRELEGVMAHELAHVRHRDMLVMTVAATMAMAISFAARILFWNTMFSGGRSRGVHPAVLFIAGIFALIGALLIQAGISRTREYKADAGGARICGNPLMLASALEKLEYVGRHRPMRMGSPASSGLFIANPFNDGSFITGLFSTHPPMAKRVARLRHLTQYSR